MKASELIEILRDIIEASEGDDVEVEFDRAGFYTVGLYANGNLIMSYDVRRSVGMIVENFQKTTLHKSPTDV